MSILTKRISTVSIGRERGVCVCGLGSEGAFTSAHYYYHVTSLTEYSCCCGAGIAS